MAPSVSSLRPILPAAHKAVPAAAAHTFLVVCPSGARAKAVVAAIQAATNGAGLGLTLTSRVVAYAARRSGGVEDEDVTEDNVKAKGFFLVGAGDDVPTAEDFTDDNVKVKGFFRVGGGDDPTTEDFTDDNVKDKGSFLVGAGDDPTAEDFTNINVKAKGSFLVGAGDDPTAEDFTDDNVKAKGFFRVGGGDDPTAEDFTDDNVKAKGSFDDRTKDSVKAKGAGGEEPTHGDAKLFYLGDAGEELTNNNSKSSIADDRTGTGMDISKPANDVVVFGYGEMTMTELVVMFYKETARSLEQVKHFPVGNDDETSLASLIASCDAVGEKIHNSAHLLDHPEGRPVVHSLIALHLRIFSCAGGARIRKRGASMPDMWSGNRHRLPCKENRDGSLMEILLYSKMLADAALERFIGQIEWDFTEYA